MMRNRHTFRTTVEYAFCLNTLVEVEGNAEEGVIAVYALGEHDGLDITESLSWQTIDRLTEELDESLKEEHAEKIDQTYETMKDKANDH